VSAINEWDDSTQAPAPCQPIGCDNGYHLPGCYFAVADRQATDEHHAWLDELDVEPGAGDSLQYAPPAPCTCWRCRTPFVSG